LTNAKINVVDKRKVLVLCSGDEVLWIIGYRIHNGFKVTQQTSSIMRISISLDKQINYLQSHSQKHQPKPQQKPQQKTQNKPQQKKQSIDNSQKITSEPVSIPVQEPVLVPIEKKSKNVKPNPRGPRKTSRPAKDA
jgi:hypothetical protein